MAAPIFPGVEDILDLIFAELPDGVFATDRADDVDFDKRSFSSSELRAHAQMFANAYELLSQTYQDKFISTVTEAGLNPWEKDLFATSQDSSLSFTRRQQNLLSKLRSIGGISLPAIRSVVDGILTPQGLTFAILPYSGQSNGVDNGAWLLGVSALGAGTYLSGADPLIGARQDPGYTPLDCSGNYAAAGLTADQYAAIQQTAYAYEVQIYGLADNATIALLDKQLTALEPARSTHYIRNNVSTFVDPAIYEWNTDQLPWWVS